MIKPITPCLPCARELHDECLQSPCCCPDEGDNPETFSSERTKKSSPPRHPGNVKPDDEIGISAGRKRAAKLFKIDPEAPCEWRGLSNCGGGLNPIVGCITGKQQHRHHGPVKRTNKNNRANIHLICDDCHNLWHAKNNKVYDEKTFSKLPHEPRALSVVELLDRGAAL